MAKDKRSYLQRMQEALAMRDAGRQQGVANQLAGVPSDFMGPVQTPEAATPEQQAAQALAKARFMSQQAQQLAPPTVEQLGLSPKDPRKMNSGAYDFLRSALSGEPEQQALAGRIGAAGQEAGAAQEQMKLTETSRQRSEDVEVRKTLGRGQIGLTGGAKAIAEAAALRGDTGAYAQAFGTQHQILANKKLVDEGKRSEEAYLAMKGGLHDLEERGLSNDPKALGALQLRIGVLADDKNAVGEASRLFSGIASDEALQRERDKNNLALTEQIRRHKFDEARKITDDIVDFQLKLAPMGVDLDGAMAFVLNAHGDELPEDMSQRVYDSVELMREPLQRAAKISQALEAEKTLNTKSDRYFEEYKRYFDAKTGKPVGWLKQNSSRESGFTIGGKPVKMKDYFEMYFRDRQKELQGEVEGPSGGTTGPASGKPPSLEQNSELMGRLKQRSDAAAVEAQAQAKTQEEENARVGRTFGASPGTFVGRP